MVNKSLADTVVSECNKSYWVQSPELHDLKTFSNDIIKIVGVINTSIKCNDWIATGIDVTVVEDGHRPIIGRDLFPKLGFSVIQMKQVANIDQNQCPIKRQISFDFPDLITRVDADTVPVENYLDENGWVTGDRSDILIEEAMQKAQVDAGRRYNGDHNKSISRFIMHPKPNNPIPRTEQSLDLKLARKVTKRSKRDLRGLWETLAPGSTVVRTSDTTTVIKEPGVPEVCVRNSDIAKFGTRAERNTDLWEYAKRRPLPYEKPRMRRFLNIQKN